MKRLTEEGRRRRCRRHLSWGACVFLGAIAWTFPGRTDDCNENGIDDLEDIRNASSLDCNANAIPDECDLSGIAFEQASIIRTQEDAGAVVLADFDGDGDLDVATEGREVYWNDGTGAFLDSTRLAALGEGRASEAIGSADVDGDGRQDLVSVSHVRSTGEQARVEVFLGLGNGAFADPLVASIADGPVDLVTGDIDGDDAAEIIVVSNRGSELVLVEYGASGLTTEVTSLPDHSRRATLADLNGDGLLDVAIPRFGTREAPGQTITVLFRHPNGGYEPPASYEVGTRPVEVLPADADNDADLDLFVISLDSSEVSLLSNHGDGTFAEAAGHTVASGRDRIELVDLDSDGAIDIVTVGPLIDYSGQSSYGVSILFGDGSGGYLDPLNLHVPVDPAGIQAADFDGDGQLDLAIAGLNSGSMVFVRQSSHRSFDLPTYMGIRTRGGSLLPRPGDLDGDGDIDLVVGTRGLRFGVLENASGDELRRGCTPFLRGDVNSDGAVSLSDLVMLERRDPDDELPCWDAADVLEDERVDTCDAGELWRLLFRNEGWGDPMPSPFPAPGLDLDPIHVPDGSEGCGSGAGLPVGEGPLPIGCRSYDPVAPRATDDVLRLGSVSAEPGEEVSIPVYLRPTVDVDAVQVVLSYDPELLELESGFESLDFTGSFYETFFGESYTIVYNHGRSRSTFTYGDRPQGDLTVYPGDGIAVLGIIGHLFFSGFEIPAGDEVLVANIRARVTASATPESEIVVTPIGGSEAEGAGPFKLRTEISYRGEARLVSTLPAVEPAILAIVGDTSFFRGDANRDDRVDLSDATSTLGVLFLGAPRGSCDDARDANDDGRVDVSDAIYTLAYLFLGGPDIPPPFEEEGFDPTPDGLWCFEKR